LAVLFMAIGSVYAQPLDTSPAATTAPAIDPAAAVSFPPAAAQWAGREIRLGGDGDHGDGSLRVLCKPIMTVIENVVANDPAKAAEARRASSMARFSNGWLLPGFWGIIKLPVIKAAGPTA
jgi:hypothetical protein